MDIKSCLDGSVSIQQSQLIDKVSKNTGIEKSNPVYSLIDPSVLTNKSDAKPFDESEQNKYRRIVRCLMYPTVRTRPDLAVSASLLVSYTNNLTNTHMMSGKCALRYLRETLDRDMKINLAATTQLTAYVDATWRSEIGKSSRSHSEMLLMYGNAVIEACSSLQKRISLTSTEAEFIAFSKAAKTVLWLRSALIERDIDQEPRKVFQDNRESTEWASGRAGRYFIKRKHIYIGHYYIMSLVEEWQINMIPVSSENMKADIPT